MVTVSDSSCASALKAVQIFYAAGYKSAHCDSEPLAANSYAWFDTSPSTWPGPNWTGFKLVSTTATPPASVPTNTLDAVSVSSVFALAFSFVVLFFLLGRGVGSVLSLIRKG